MKDKAYRMYEKYGAPFAAMALAGYMVGKDEEEINWLVGNPIDWAPVMSATNLSVLNNPLFDAAEGAQAVVDVGVKAAGGELKDGEAERLLKKGLEKAVTSTVPGVSSVINEMNRYRKAYGEEKVSTELVNELVD